jgi:SAM-dependent methyltransferase
MPEGWQWDETLYAGSAPHYVRGRLPYAPGLGERLAEVLALDGRGRLLDVGCGPGILALLLSPYFAEAVGVDPDAGMLAEAAIRAEQSGAANVRWVQARGEDLPAGLGTFRVAIFGQSFHWMDQDRVAATVAGMLEPDGAFVHVSDVKEARPERGDNLPYPQPPYAAIQALIDRRLGPVRRAGQGVLPHGTPGGEATVLSRARFRNPLRVRVPAGGVLIRSIADMVAWVWSQSGSAPHLFGPRAEAFEAELRGVLHDASPAGLFAEQPPDTEVWVWRTPRQ